MRIEHTRRCCCIRRCCLRGGGPAFRERRSMFACSNSTLRNRRPVSLVVPSYHIVSFLIVIHSCPSSRAPEGAAANFLARETLALALSIFLSFSPLLFLTTWLLLVCPHSLSTGCILALHFHLLHYRLLPVLPQSKHCNFSLTLTAWLSLAYPFFSPLLFLNAFLPSVQMFCER